ncbi:MAG: hypothetical protein C0507_11555 [Cyanobacteria bacterium PR.3.49]|nr:hypothetical protein [Cyanobacteria bacterium PR.3.49]
MAKTEKAKSKGADNTATAAKLDSASIQSALSRVDNCIKEAYKNGSWAYKSGDAACIEPTAFCAIARRKDASARKQVIEFLCANQNEDGGWSTSPGMGKSDWTSGLALLALRVLLKEESGETPRSAVIDKAINYLFEARTEFYGALAKFLLQISKGDEGLNYPRGWPWSPGCFHWVEPTSYALLALKLPSHVQKSDSRRVIARADNFLLEHACKDGGWNHGNDLCLSVYLPPFAVTTAEALIALQDQKSASAVQHAFHNLKNTIGYGGSAMSVAWTAIAELSYGKDASDSIRNLLSRQHEDGSFGPNLMVTALSMLALQAHQGDNALKIS